MALVAGSAHHTQSRLTSSAGSIARPAFRVKHAPISEPPFDDECDALDARGGHGIGVPACAGVERPILLAPTPSPKPAAGLGSADALASPAAHAAGRYVQVCLEVLNGYRPPSHLRTLSGPIEFADILRHLRLRRNGAWRGGAACRGDAAAGVTGNGPAATAPPLARPANVRPAHAPARGHAATKPSSLPAAMPPNRAGTTAFRLLRLRVTEPLPGRVEAVAVIAHAHGSVAIAMRLEARKSSWVCTVFQLV